MATRNDARHHEHAAAANEATSSSSDSSSLSSNESLGVRGRKMIVPAVVSRSDEQQSPSIMRRLHHRVDDGEKASSAMRLQGVDNPALSIDSEAEIDTNL